MSLITLTSGRGCGESSIALAVSRKLEIPLFDDKRLLAEAAGTGIDKRAFEGIDRKIPGFWSKLLYLRPRVYMELLESVVLRAASGGEGIFPGHGAPFLLQDFDCAFHVRLHSSPAARVERIMAETGVNPNAAKKELRKSDSDRKKFIRYAFRRDWDDPSLYDLVINLDKMGEEAAVETVVRASETPGVQACSLKTMEALERLSLASRVRAVIRETSLRPESLYVDVSGNGVVHLSGEINPLESKDRILDAVRSVPGVVSVQSSIRGEKLHDI